MKHTLTPPYFESLQSLFLERWNREHDDPVSMTMNPETHKDLTEAQINGGTPYIDFPDWDSEISFRTGWFQGKVIVNWVTGCSVKVHTSEDLGPGEVILESRILGQ